MNKRIIVNKEITSKMISILDYQLEKDHFKRFLPFKRKDNLEAITSHNEVVSNITVSVIRHFKPKYKTI